MRFFVGITDHAWYEQLSAQGPDEVNFWKPGEKGGFGVLSPGEVFLFKLHSPRQFIVGGGHFVKFSRLPLSLAWLAFGEKNGVKSVEEFYKRVEKYRKADPGSDPSIGCIVLAQPFWFAQSDWIPVPADWPTSTVQGKSFDPLELAGARIWSQVRERLEGHSIGSSVGEIRSAYAAATVNVRLGQGAFKVLVTDAYSRRCAITGESTLPVLEAAHIRPFAADGPHATRNGLLLRSDMHILFDKGLLTVNDDYRIGVSPEIRDLYVNGKLYYSFEGSELKSLPFDTADRPAKEFLTWHHDNVFRAS